MDRRSTRRSDGADAWTRHAEPGGACRSDRDDSVPAAGDAHARSAHWLGETGAGRSAQPSGKLAAAVHADRRGRPAEQHRARARRGRDLPRDLRLAVRERRSRRPARDPVRTAERPACAVQPRAGAAARRRQRAGGIAHRLGGRLLRSHQAVRLPDHLWPDAHRRPLERHRPHPGDVDLRPALMAKARVVSGMRPTGRLHIGHLVGALKNWAALQDQYECLYFVADWHALTSEYANTQALVGNALDNVADWIAAGVDPERSTIFIQSLVPEHAELALLLSMVVPVPWLERVPTYKEQREQITDKDLSNVGFLNYPLLQTADIAIYDGRFVPVGDDQVAHLELSREAVRRFNQFYGEVLVEPQPLLTATSRLVGLDNRKMSKSYGNTIDLNDDANAVTQKVRQMYTDPKRIRADIPGTVEGNPVFMYHDAFNTDTAEVEDLKARYREGKVGDVEVKTKLAKAMNAMLEPMRERRREVAANPER